MERSIPDKPSKDLSKNNASSLVLGDYFATDNVKKHLKVDFPHTWYQRCRLENIFVSLKNFLKLKRTPLVERCFTIRSVGYQEEST